MKLHKIFEKNHKGLRLGENFSCLISEEKSVKKKKSKPSTLNFTDIKYVQAGKMLQWLRSFAALPDDRVWFLAPTPGGS